MLNDAPIARWSLRLARAALLAALCAPVGCAGVKRGQASLELDVRATTSGKARAFEFTPGNGELIAWNRGDKLLQLWVAPGSLRVGTSVDREVPPGCRGGFLQLAGPQLDRGSLDDPDDGRMHRSEASTVMALILLCPRAGAPEGWQGWHADFDVISGGLAPGTLPPVADFAVSWDASQHELRIGSRSVRGAVAVGDGAAPVRAHPEMFALGVVMGVVPVARDGRYDVVLH